MVRVLLAVAHSSLRATLEECLVQGGEMSCGTAATSEELWSRLSHDEWDVLVLDLRLPEQTKRATVHTLHARYPDLPILVLSLSRAVPFGRWQEAGARGFLAKAKLSTELIEAVRVISRGGKYFREEEGQQEGEGGERIP
ncbi:MAG: response regulator [Nitrospirota bacterium]|nr:response regulator [Nitrospirota bacterium]